VNLFLIFNTFANLIFNFVSSTASVSITSSPSKLLHLIVDVDVDLDVDVDVNVDEDENEHAAEILSCERRPTPAFIYNFVQLTFGQAGSLFSAQCPQIAACSQVHTSKLKLRVLYLF